MSASRIDKTELLSKTIQTYLNNDCALLIGSGNSIPYGLPSMLELADEIKSKLNFKYKSNIKWQRFVEELNKTNNLELSLDTVEIDDYIHRDIIWVVWELIHLKDRTALNNILLNSIPPALTNILNKFVQKTDPTNIITTNYDRLIEYSCDMVNGKLNDGFSGEFIRRFSKFQSKPNKRVINLFKVHGSINWFKHKENNRILSTSLFDKTELEDKYEPQIVTPGNGKYRETHYEPFRTVISKADEAIRNSESYLCIGYGFNDEHIQPIILEENQLNKKPIVIVTKSITEKMKKLFIDNDSDNCLLIAEGDSSKGSKIVYFSTKVVEFDESFWHLDKFYKLWFE